MKCKRGCFAGLSARVCLLCACLIGVVTGCVSSPGIVVFTPNTDTPGVVICVGDKEEGSFWDYHITREDVRRGYIDFPVIQFRKPGFLPTTFTLGRMSMTQIREFGPYDTVSGEGWRIQGNGNPLYVFSNKDRITLRKDPTYAGSTTNRVQLTINSEPQGGRVYADGRFIGTTPLTVSYDILPTHYQYGKMSTSPLIVVADGCKPQKQQLEFEITSDLRWEQGKTVNFATLFLLEHDPNYRPPVIVQQQPGSSGGESTLNLKVQQEKDTLDVLEQTGRIITIFRALRPVR